MKITKTFSRYNQPQNKQQLPSKRGECSFGIHFDTELGKDAIMNMGDGIRYIPTQIKNYTELLRGQNAFKQLPDFLNKHYPQGAPIYDYACSTGHEASSIVISLLHYLKKYDAEKFLPIKAFDNNAKIIEKANTKTLKLNRYEIDLLKKMGNINIEDYFTYTGKQDKDQMIFAMKDNLAQNINFQYGDIFEDLAQNKLSEEPCVLFFRNAFQFLTPKGIKELTTNMFEKLKPKSSVIIGDKDIELNKANLVLQKAGFIQQPQDVPSQVKSNDFMALLNSVTAGDNLSKYTFIKQ